MFIQLHSLKNKNLLGYNRGMLTIVDFCLKFRSRYFSANKSVDSLSLNRRLELTCLQAHHSFSATFGLAEAFEITCFTKNGLADTCY